jgi:adenylate cyclase class 2
VLVQRDTYFQVSHGRLKLRQEEGAPAQLIAYDRPDRPAQRESRYRIVVIEEPEGLAAALESALGIKAVVAKTRQLLIWEGVRIHLDRVDRLGAFLEFEAPVGGGARAEAEARVAALRDAVRLEDADLVEGSYCDLMLAATAEAT